MIVAALALAGIFISLYLTLYKLGIIGELSCTIGSCETVNSSKRARFLGVAGAPWGAAVSGVAGPRLGAPLLPRRVPERPGGDPSALRGRAGHLARTRSRSRR